MAFRIFVFFLLPCFSYCQSIEELYSNWIEAYNNNSLEELGTMYLEGAGTYLGNNLVATKEGRIKSWTSMKGRLSTPENYAEAFRTTGNGGHIMTLGYLKDGDNIFASLIAWRNVGGQYKIEFESVSEVQSDIIDLSLEKINHQRRAWEDYSNNHDPAGLISSVYTSEAYYFNQGKVYQGQEKIVNRYNYMTQDGWKIRLEKAGIIPVTDQLVFEIGKYYSSGSGQYLLVWEKQQKGDWQIALDFNF